MGLSLAANHRVVVLPIQTADLSYLSLLLKLEGPLVTTLLGLNTLFGQLTFIRRDMPPTRWMSSPYLRYDEVIEQRKQWAKQAQARYFLCPSLQIHASHPDDVSPTDGIASAQPEEYRQLFLQARLYDAHAQEDIGDWQMAIQPEQADNIDFLTTVANDWLHNLYHYWSHFHGTTHTYQPKPTPPSPLVDDIVLLNRLHHTHELDAIAENHSPADTHGWFAWTLGRHLQNAGQYTQAQPYFEQAINSQIGTPSFKAQCHLSCGQILALMDQWQQALHHWEQAQQLDASDPNIALNLGHGLENCQRDGDAIQIFTKLQRQHPDELRAGFALGRLYSKQERWKDALQQYTHLAKLAPDDPWPLSNMATCYLQLGHPDKARTYLHKTCLLDPNGEAGSVAQMILNQMN